MALTANRAEVRIRNQRYNMQAEAVGRTARLMVDLVGSLMGRKVFDRPTRSFG